MHIMMHMLRCVEARPDEELVPAYTTWVDESQFYAAGLLDDAGVLFDGSGGAPRPNLSMFDAQAQRTKGLFEFFGKRLEAWASSVRERRAAEAPGAAPSAATPTARTAVPPAATRPAAAPPAAAPPAAAAPASAPPAAAPAVAPTRNSQRKRPMGQVPYADIDKRRQRQQVAQDGMADDSD